MNSFIEIDQNQFHSQSTSNLDSNNLTEQIYGNVRQGNFTEVSLLLIPTWLKIPWKSIFSNMIPIGVRLSILLR